MQVMVFPRKCAKFGNSLVIMFAAISMLAACGGGGGGGSTDVAVPGGPQPNQVTVEDVQARLIVWYPIAHSADNPENRNVGRGIPEDGWTPFVNNVVIPQTSSRGIHRVQLHNPFGRRRDFPPPLFERALAFQFDQYLEALASGMTGLTDDFVEAWLPVTGMGYEVIGYIGTPFLDPDSQTLLDEGTEQAFDARVAQAIAPILQAGMSIAFDAAVITDNESEDFKLAQRLRSQGERVYVEAGPPMTHTWWFDFPIISRDDTWRNRLDDPQFAPPELLSAEVLRIARKQPAWETLGSDEWPQEVCAIIAEGDSAIVEDFIFRDPNRGLSTLADCANALLDKS